MTRVLYHLYVYGFMAAVLVGLTAGMSDAFAAHVTCMIAHGPMGVR